MKIIRAKAGHVEYEAGGPPQLIVADVHGGEVVFLLWDHPDDTLEGMREEGRRIRNARRIIDNRLVKRKN